MGTILEVFNEDCWRLVLDFLPTSDVVMLERVSHGWQDVIFRYFQGVGISIEYGAAQKLWYGRNHKASHTHRIFRILEDDPDQFRDIIRKWGPSIRKTDCANKDSLQVICENCPDLKDVTFYGLKDDVLSSESLKTFKNLKRVHFKDCYSLTDQCVNHWLENYNIDELVVWGAKDVTGKCLATPHSTKLKTLCFNECDALDFRHLLPATKYLTQLKKLELIHVPKEIFQNSHELLDQLPGLEDLGFRGDKKMDIGDRWAESIGRLSLRRLDVAFNPGVTDECLEKASIGFGRLNELLLERCERMTGRGAKAACSAAGPALRGLQIGSNVKLYDKHIEHIVRNCPNLVWMDLSFCHGITNGIIERIGNARTIRDRTLRVRVECTYVEDEGDKFPWLIVDFGD